MLSGCSSASCIGGDRDSYLLSQQHGGDYIQKIAKDDSSHADYVTRSAVKVNIITFLSF